MHETNEFVVRERGVEEHVEALEGELERPADEEGRIFRGCGRAVAVAEVRIFHLRHRPAVKVADGLEVMNGIVKKRSNFVHVASSGNLL